MAEFMDYLAWNVYVGNPPKFIVPRIEALLKKHEPEIAVLMEAKFLHGHLGGMGYTVCHLKPRRLRPGNQSATANIAILVRNDLVLEKRGRLTMTKFWRGPVHGLPQDPRVYRWVKTRKRAKSKLWKSGGAHTPFGKAARLESRFRLVRWMKRTLPFRPCVLVLDANMNIMQFREVIAGPAGAQAGGSGIDLIAVKNAKLVSAKNLGKNGSDHPAMLYKVAA